MYAKNVALPAFMSVERKSGNRYQWFKRASRRNKTGLKKGLGKLPWLEGAGGGIKKASFMVKSGATAYEALRSWEGWEWRLDSQGSSWYPHWPKKGPLPFIRGKLGDVCLRHRTGGAAQEA